VAECAQAFHRGSAVALDAIEGLLKSLDALLFAQTGKFILPQPDGVTCAYG
jgi:hypothetical protein